MRLEHRGITATQYNDTHEITLTKNGKTLLRASCEKPLSDRELISTVDEYLARKHNIYEKPLSTVANEIRSVAGEFSNYIATHAGTGFLYNVADAQNRYLRELADRLELYEELSGIVRDINIHDNPIFATDTNVGHTENGGE